MAAAPVDLKQQLQDRQKTLQGVQTQLDTLQTQAQDLRVQVQTLGTVVSDYDRTVKAYGAESKVVTDGKKSADDAITKLAATVADKVKAKKDLIDKEIAAQEKKITDQAAAADQASKDSDAAQAAATQASADAKAADDAIAQLRGLVTQGSGTVAQAVALLKQADSLATSGNAAGAYFLLAEAQKLKVDLPGAAQLASTLADAHDKAIKAKAAVTDKAAVALKAKTASDQAAHALASAKAGRITTIVAALAPLN